MQAPRASAGSGANWGGVQSEGAHNEKERERRTFLRERKWSSAYTFCAISSSCLQLLGGGVNSRGVWLDLDELERREVHVMHQVRDQPCNLLLASGPQAPPYQTEQLRAGASEVWTSGTLPSRRGPLKARAAPVHIQSPRLVLCLYSPLCRSRQMTLTSVYASSFIWTSQTGSVYQQHDGGLLLLPLELRMYETDD